MLIFQFTLPREERRQVQAQPLTLQNFNPRSHERSDHITQSFVFRFFNFNPRSHERSDLLEVMDVSDMIFQSTLPREERPTTDEALTHVVNFNPRSHERSDGSGYVEGQRYLISIHAPTRGATNWRVMYPITIEFQSTLPREERLLSCHFKRGYIHFNPRSHERSDFTSKIPVPNNIISIHAPTRGATKSASISYQKTLFQSTLPREERLCWTNF